MTAQNIYDGFASTGTQTEFDFCTAPTHYLGSIYKCRGNHDETQRKQT